jgi:flagellar hook-length control protein FliK
MPAISAAANPVNAVSSPTSNAGKSPSGSESPDRPFSTVLAERTSAQRPTDQASRKGSDTPSKEQAAKTDTADQATPATDVASTPIAVPFVPAELLRAIAENSDPAALGEQVQMVGQVMQTLAQPRSGAGLLAEPIDLARTAQSQTTLPDESGITASRPGTAATSREDAPALASVTEIPTAGIAHGKPTDAAPEPTATPAKLAANKEQIALPADAKAVKATDIGATKADATLAAANPALAVAAALHAPAAASQNHGGSDIRITTPIGSPHWESAVGNSLVMMTGTGREKAELVLTPPQLGRIEVSISMKGDEATAIFVSQNPAVRDAIESALPRLREVLADAGITLGQTQVGAESQGQAANDRQNGDNSSRRGIADAVGTVDSPSGPGGRDGAAYRVTSRSLVDTFA